MIALLDTSALLPLMVAEPVSPACRRVWDDADDVGSSRLCFVEAAAALAQAKRLKRITARAHRSALGALPGLWDQIQIVEVNQALVERAAVLTDRFELRGYDAVHCASAELVNDGGAVAVAGDRELLRAWRGLGLPTYDTAQPWPAPTGGGCRVVGLVSPERRRTAKAHHH